MIEAKQEMEILKKEKQLENRKDKLRWLRIEQVSLLILMYWS